MRHAVQAALQEAAPGQPPLSPPPARAADPLSARRLFACLPTPEQSLYLQLLKHGYCDLGPVPSQLFFETLLSMTIEGFFNAPVYTGNEEAVASRMPGRAAARGAMST